MDNAIREYAKKIAEAMFDRCNSRGQIDAIIASVSAPSVRVIMPCQPCDLGNEYAECTCADNYYTRADLDAAVAREREECAKDAVEVIDSVTGPTGGWIASPREVRNAFIREIRARSAQGGKS